MAKISLALVIMVVIVVTTMHKSEAQSDCGAKVQELSPCAAAVGANPQDPSPECCAALKNADVDCICSIVQATVQLPSDCNTLPAQCP